MEARRICPTDPHRDQGGARYPHAVRSVCTLSSDVVVRLKRAGSLRRAGVVHRRLCEAIVASAMIASTAGCAPSRIEHDPILRDAPVGAGLDALRQRIDAVAAPWPDASSALSLLRDSGGARAFTPSEVKELVHDGGRRWEVVYRLDPSAVRSELDRADAAILRVTEWISHGSDHATDSATPETPGRAFRSTVVRRFRIEGLATGRTVVVDVPLRGAAGPGWLEGECWQAFVNGAPIEAPLGASHVAIELARDEATVIRVGGCGAQ